jgi:hypothetical protein
VDVTINDGAGAARSRGVSVRVSANSGDDSGNTPDEVGFVKIYEPGVNEATAPLAAYDPNKAYPYVLSSGVAGSPTPKEVAARAYSLGLRAGEPLSTIITLIDEQEAPADEIERYETFMLAWRFRGDDATPSDLNGDANYPPANLLDPCLGVKWRSADNTSAFVRLDFGAFVELRGLAILGHNFADFAGGSGSLTLTLRLTQLVDGEEVITSHDLTAQASSAMALLSLEHARIRLLTLQIDHDGDDPEAPTHFEIGRLLAIADLGVVQPRFNLADDFTWSIKEYAKLYATPSARYAVNPVNVRSARIALEDYTIDERRPLDVAFSHVGRRRPVLLLLKPELLPTLDRPDYPSNVRPEEMAIYGYLTGDSLAWRMRGVDFGSAALEIEEAAE